MNYSVYKKRIGINGITRREREINNFKDKIIRYAKDNPSYKEVKINNVDDVLIVDSSTNLDTFSIKSTPDHNFYAGDIVDWENAKWLILTSRHDKEVYCKGMMQKCTYELKWQNKNRDIIKQPVIVSSGTGKVITSSSGKIEISNLVITGANERVVYISYNEESKKIKRLDRFFIDNDLETPLPYRVTGIDNVTNVYDGHGYIMLNLKEDTLHDDDNISLMICDYKEKDEEPIKQEFYSQIVSDVDGIILGYKKGTRFSPSFYNDDILVDGIKPLWSVESIDNSKINIAYDNDDLIVSVLEKDMLGQSIKVSLSDVNNKYSLCSKIYTVESIY